MPTTLSIQTCLARAHDLTGLADREGHYDLILLYDDLALGRPAGEPDALRPALGALGREGAVGGAPCDGPILGACRREATFRPSPRNRASKGLAMGGLLPEQPLA